MCVCTWVLWWRSTVHFNADGPSGPSSGSVADPWNVIVCPGRTFVPSAGELIVGDGRVLPTTIGTVAVDDRPAGAVTVRRALNVRDAGCRVRVASGSAAVEVLPSPKFQR